MITFASTILSLISIALIFKEVISFDVNVNRRSFIFKSGVGGLISTSTSIINPLPSNSEDLTTITKTIKVSPLAHTFKISKGDVKPIRENDATRVLTNAKVVFMFYDNDNPYETLAKEIFDLTIKRKIGEGAGVTPGRVRYASLGGTFKSTTDASIPYSKISTLDDISAKVTFEKGDVVFIEPIPSQGIVKDGKLLDNVAKQLNADVGGDKSGGIVSVLLNGPKAPNSAKIIDGQYDAASLLWYDF